MKLQLNTWRMPSTHTWYLTLLISKKTRKENEPVDISYTISTPAYAYRPYLTILPSLELERKTSYIPGSGLNFELRLTWLKWSMRLLSRDVWRSDGDGE